MIGWLKRMAAADSTARDASDDFWYQDVGAMSAAGISVTEDTALTLPVVADCLGALADPVGTLPLKVFDRQPDGSKVSVAGAEIADVLTVQPNEEEDACQFRSQMQWDLGAHRNAYALITPGPRGAVDQLVRVPPSAMTVRRTQSGAVSYEVLDGATGQRRAYRPDQVWHLKKSPLTRDGLRGRSILEDTGRETIGKALAVRDYGARFFKNDTRPSSVIEYPGTFKEADSKNNFVRAMKRAFGSGNRHSIAVLEHGMTWKQMSVDPEQAQFNETEKESYLDITRLWHMPHKVGILDKATFSNIEQQSLEFVIDTLMPWLVLWETAINTRLIVNRPTWFAEFNVNGLLRGDIKTRYEAYAQGRNWGWLSVNDIRRLENMDPLPEGDQYLRPLNMAPADAPFDTGAGQSQDSGRDNGMNGSRLGLRLPAPDPTDEDTRHDPIH